MKIFEEIVESMTISSLITTSVQRMWVQCFKDRIFTISHYKIISKIMNPYLIYIRFSNWSSFFEILQNILIVSFKNISAPCWRYRRQSWLEWSVGSHGSYDVVRWWQIWHHCNNSSSSSSRKYWVWRKWCWSLFHSWLSRYCKNLWESMWDPHPRVLA